QKRAGLGRAPLIDELADPVVELAGRIRMMPFDRPSEVRHFVRVIGERIESGSVFEQKFRFVERDVLERDVVLDDESPGLSDEVGNRNAIVEDIVNPAKPVRTGFDLEARLEKTLVVA